MHLAAKMPARLVVVQITFKHPYFARSQPIEACQPVYVLFPFISPTACVAETERALASDLSFPVLRTAGAFLLTANSEHADTVPVIVFRSTRHRVRFPVQVPPQKEYTMRHDA